MQLARFTRAFGQATRRELEVALVATVIIAAYLIQSLVPHKLVAMNFFYLPTMVAAYCLGMRLGGLTAFLSFLLVAIYALIQPESFLYESTPSLLAFDIAIWGSFLGLTALVVGSLSKRLQQKAQELRIAYVGVLEILTKYLESADHYTKSHSVRVAELSMAIAAKLGFSDEEVENIRAGALLHDIGKSEAVTLVKQSCALTESQRAEVAAHTLTGAQIVRSLGTILQEAVPIVLYHHHYYGGRKGQEGPVGDQIPIGARIVAVADAYDAIVTDRPYRKGRAPWQAIRELEDCAGTQFDPLVLLAFKSILPSDSIEPERELHELVTSQPARADH